MTVTELVIVLWLFCAIISSSSIFAVVQQAKQVKGPDLVLLALFSAVLGLFSGPFMIGFKLGRTYLNTLPDVSDS